MAEQRFDIQTLIVVLPLVLIVTLGISFSAFSLSYNAYTEVADGLEVRAWWDGDHADMIIIAHSEAVLPVKVQVLDKVDTGYHPSKHLMLAVTLAEPGSTHLFSAVTVSKEFRVIISSDMHRTVFDVQL